MHTKGDSSCFIRSCTCQTSTTPLESWKCFIFTAFSATVLPDTTSEHTFLHSYTTLTHSLLLITPTSMSALIHIWITCIRCNDHLRLNRRNNNFLNPCTRVRCRPVLHFLHVYLYKRLINFISLSINPKLSGARQCGAWTPVETPSFRRPKCSTVSLLPGKSQTTSANRCHSYCSFTWRSASKLHRQALDMSTDDTAWFYTALTALVKRKPPVPILYIQRHIHTCDRHLPKTSPEHVTTFIYTQSCRIVACIPEWACAPSNPVDWLCNPESSEPHVQRNRLRRS